MQSTTMPEYYAIMVLLLWTSLTLGMKVMENEDFVVGDYFYPTSVHLEVLATSIMVTVSSQV